MNGRVAKKIRKEQKRNWDFYIVSIQSLPLRNRLLWAWAIIRRTGYIQRKDQLLRRGYKKYNAVT